MLDNALEDEDLEKVRKNKRFKKILKNL